MVKLPVEIPSINGRMYYALPLSIIAGEPQYAPWFASQFVQLQAFNQATTAKESRAELRFFNADHPDCFKAVLDVEKHLMDKERIVLQIVEALRQKRYVYTYV